MISQDGNAPPGGCLPHDHHHSAAGDGTDRFYVDCSAGDALATGVRWLSVEATARRLDAVLLVATAPRAHDLAVAVGEAAALSLIAGQIIRFNRQYLQLLEMRNVYRHSRRQHVALALSLTDDKLAVADGMNAAALCVVPDRSTIPVRWLSRWQPVWIGQQESKPRRLGSERQATLTNDCVDAITIGVL